MYIIYGEGSAKELREKYLVLELDTIKYSQLDDVVKVFCVIDNDHIPLTEINQTDSLANLHEKLISNYQKQNWDFCLEAIEHLKGKFSGELDSYYDELLNRIDTFSKTTLTESWSPVLELSE